MKFKVHYSQSTTELPSIIFENKLRKVSLPLFKEFLFLCYGKFDNKIIFTLCSNAAKVSNFTKYNYIRKLPFAKNRYSH